MSIELNDNVENANVAYVEISEDDGCISSNNE